MRRFAVLLAACLAFGLSPAEAKNKDDAPEVQPHVPFITEGPLTVAIPGNWDRLRPIPLRPPMPLDITVLHDDGSWVKLQLRPTKYAVIFSLALAKIELEKTGIVVPDPVSIDENNAKLSFTDKGGTQRTMHMRQLRPPNVDDEWDGTVLIMEYALQHPPPDAPPGDDRQKDVDAMIDSAKLEPTWHWRRIQPVPPNPIKRLPHRP